MQYPPFPPPFKSAIDYLPKVSSIPFLSLLMKPKSSNTMLYSMILVELPNSNCRIISDKTLKTGISNIAKISKSLNRINNYPCLWAPGLTEIYKIIFSHDQLEGDGMT